MTSPRRILVAAPDPAALASRLTALGDEVVVARTAAEAVLLDGDTSADLLLVDVQLCPDGDGRHAVDEIRRRRDVAAVFLTDEGNEPSLRLAGMRGADGALLRPYTDRELRATTDLALCRHDATREARDHEDQFFAVSLDLLCCLGFNGYFRKLNPAWERALGYTRAELMSRPFIEFVHPDDRERTLAQNRAVREGGQALSFENRYLCKDGSPRWLLWNAAPDGAGQVIYSVARDITARRAAEEDRERLVTRLQVALAEVRSLRKIIPICSYCRKIRDDENYWSTVESYISRHTGSEFSHGVCPSCIETVIQPEFTRLDRR